MTYFLVYGSGCTNLKIVRSNDSYIFSFHTSFYQSIYMQTGKLYLTWEQGTSNFKVEEAGRQVQLENQTDL